MIYQADEYRKGSSQTSRGECTKCTVCVSGQYAVVECRGVIDTICHAYAVFGTPYFVFAIHISFLVNWWFRLTGVSGVFLPIVKSLHVQDVV